ncbi:hypothetical protein ACP86_16920 [Marinobacter sp. CP1]|jgi:hypothetical protein|uniref:hypothetical protein n=1 Tax=Marinobacter sp. CP1 TaxID=1671721 RepID=UPI00069D1283|nr:hypothetical protein [Marinobacter sp. CP1]AKV97701.1 hypothetical protein ACP86_16920 [Marinobacter sp. CP1]|tara:strand:- start:2609 stop:2971 length:363 start_codon:yes stop_codon:yes gene_type:complete
MGQTIFNQTQTRLFHWNVGEVIVGERAFAAGAIEDSVLCFNDPVKFLQLYTILLNLFRIARLPALSGDEVGDLENSYWVADVKGMTVGGGAFVGAIQAFPESRKASGSFRVEWVVGFAWN